MDALSTDHLSLTDFLDLSTLQEIQDSFAALASVSAHITDARGQPLTQPNPTREFLRRQRAIAAADESDSSSGASVNTAQRDGREYVAPIVVDGQRLGSLRMGALPPADDAGLDDTRLQQLSEKLSIDPKSAKALLTAAGRARNNRPAAIQFLHMLANAIARLCYQEYQLRQRVNELTAVYKVSTILADARELSAVLDRTVRICVEMMECKAASIRLVDEEHDELTIRAGFNLSKAYLSKGKILLSRSGIDHVALSPRGYEYVRDMSTDPRVQYPQESEREGIVSLLSVGMRYKGKAIGVLRVYTEKEQAFSQLKIDLLKAVAAQAAAAIENTRLLGESIEAERLEKQVRMAADVQQRMVPRSPPAFPAADLASVYVPCFELGGDFYDFIALGDEDVGLVVADVSGKGVAASLIMAAVRAALRAQADNVYYLNEVVRRVNTMLCRDTRGTEFVTLFYGVLDSPTRRFTYCNAGHPPAMVLRGNEILELGSEDTILGINPDETYHQHIFEFQPNDLLLIYTDGLTDAMNYSGETFGRARVVQAFREGGKSAEVVAQNILWQARKFVGISKRTDDITMIVAKVR